MRRSSVAAVSLSGFPPTRTCFVSTATASGQGRGARSPRPPPALACRPEQPRRYLAADLSLGVWILYLLSSVASRQVRLLPLTRRTPYVLSAGGAGTEPPEDHGPDGIGSCPPCLLRPSLSSTPSSCPRQPISACNNGLAWWSARDAVCAVGAAGSETQGRPRLMSGAVRALVRRWVR